MLNHLASKLGKNVRAFSSGSAPGGRLNPLAVEVLTQADLDVSGYRSKSWNEFASDAAPAMRIVITSAIVRLQRRAPIGQPPLASWFLHCPFRVETKHSSNSVAVFRRWASVPRCG
jgi:hypothetical protein